MTCCFLHYLSEDNNTKDLIYCIQEYCVNTLSFICVAPPYGPCWGEMSSAHSHRHNSEVLIFFFDICSRKSGFMWLSATGL